MSKVDDDADFHVFEGEALIVSGGAEQAFEAWRAATLARREVLVFSAASGRTIDGGSLTPLDVATEPRAETRGRGRPKLGVVAREVTLLPRHWDWLSSQPGGASVALRKLVETARAANAGEDKRRAARHRADRFMATMAGDAPGYEDASRALYRGERDAFVALTKAWPKDVRDVARKLAEGAFE